MVGGCGLVVLVGIGASGRLVASDVWMFDAFCFFGCGAALWALNIVCRGGRVICL